MDQIVEAPLQSGEGRVLPLARGIARRLPCGSIAAVLALLAMSAVAIGFYSTGIDADEPSGSLSEELRSSFTEFCSNTPICGSRH